jgi:molecular chaperone DnaJ
VYKPVNCILCVLINSLEEQIEQLAPDPFDDQLIDEFQEYLKVCCQDLKQSQNTFRSLPNLPRLAKVATDLYYSLSEVGDRLEELAYFPLNYDNRYLHTGQEMLRIATPLHCEAKESVNQ